MTLPYTEDIAASTEGQSNVLRWEYVMQSDNKRNIDLNEGAVWLDDDGYACDNRIFMFVQRADGSVKPSAEITGGYLEEREDRGFMLNVK